MFLKPNFLYVLLTTIFLIQKFIVLIQNTSSVKFSVHALFWNSIYKNLEGVGCQKGLDGIRKTLRSEDLFSEVQF